MRRVFTEQLQPGMVIAQNIMGVDGRHLLVRNEPITKQYIQYLNHLGIKSIYIADTFSSCEIPEIISNQVLTNATEVLSKSITGIMANKTLDIKTLRQSVILLLQYLLNNRQELIQFENVRTHDHYLLFHSLYVAILSLMTGLSLAYSEAKLMDLGLGALLHDIGMFSIDSTILKKEGPLSSNEIQIIKRHTESGFNTLRAYPDVPPKVAHIAYQHHERFDGCGYPGKIDRKQIVDYAKIVAVADAFDAIISDRPFRPGYSISEGLMILNKSSGSLFDPEVVEAFAANVAPYPSGS